MGNQQSKKEQSNSNEESGFLFDYLSDVKSSSKSQIQPFYKSQISALQKLFRQLDKANNKSIQISDLQKISFISQHPLFQRIISLYQQQLKKIKTKKISMEIFLHLLTVFHPQTDIENKFRFLFRLYDWDKDFRLNHSDLCNTFRLLFREKMIFQRLVDEEAIKNMAAEALLKYGTRGEIKIQQFMELVPPDQVKQVMTFKYNKKYW